MDTFWNEVLTVSLGTAIPLGLVSLLLPKLVGLAMNRSLATFQNRLARAEIRFRQYEERRATAIEGTYARLTRLLDAAGELVAEFGSTDPPPVDQLWDEMAKTERQFRRFYYPRAIYFTDDLSTRVESLHKEIRKAVNLFRRGARGQNRKRDYWDEAVDALEQKAFPLLQVLRDELRKSVLVLNPAEYST